MPTQTRAFPNLLSAASLAASLLALGLSAPVLANDRHDDRDDDHRERPQQHGSAAPKIVLISLDGARPDLIQRYIDEGVLPRDGGLARVSRGVIARQNVTATPSLTAVAHIAIATGSTAVNNDIPANNVANILSSAGVDTGKLGIRTSGPAVNIYVNLQGREQGGAVDPATYTNLVMQIATVLNNASDPNDRFNYTLRHGKIFTTVESRPLNCADEVIGLCTSRRIGQDFGDVFAMLAEGYNFDGLQSPGVARLDDAPFNAATSVFSVPNFYGAHGHNSDLESMSATFLAAGPTIRDNRTIARIHNIDVAPTIMHILGVKPEGMDGRVLQEILR
jgi:predicted AlkP superfamily phosphohydrolase/phosphomutase